MYGCATVVVISDVRVIKMVVECFPKLMRPGQERVEMVSRVGNKNVCRMILNHETGSSST